MYSEYVFAFAFAFFKALTNMLKLIIIFLVFSLILLFTDGELEAEWLVAAGFPQLTKAFQEVFINIYTKYNIILHLIQIFSFRAHSLLLIWLISEM